MYRQYCKECNEPRYDSLSYFKYETEYTCPDCVERLRQEEIAYDQYLNHKDK